MKKEIFLATTLALSGCASPRPSQVPEPTSAPTKDPRLVDMVDCREGPFWDRKIVAVGADYVSFGARRASDHQQISIKITPGENKTFSVIPENTVIDEPMHRGEGLMKFNSSGIYWEIEGAHSDTGDFIVAALADCKEVKLVEPQPQS